MKSKPKEQRKMSVKLAFYFLGFMFVILIIIWLCETVFLESIYKLYIKSSVHSQADKVAAFIGSGNLEKDIDDFAEKYESTIILADSRCSTVIKSKPISHSYINLLAKEHIRDLYDETVENDGEKIVFSNADNVNNSIQTDTDDDLSVSIEKIILMKIFNVGEESYIVMVESELAPVAATVEALRMELVIITVVVLAFSVLMVVFMSKRLATPITNTTEIAKKLAEGEFPKDFNQSGYLEIAELNKTLLYASNELERVDKLSNEIIANVSHDLRTPLTMISGYAEAMRDIPGESSPENLQIIIDEADRLKNLVNQLLFLSKLKSGSNKLQMSAFDITEVTKGIVARINKMVEQDGFEVVFANIEHAHVYADKERIEQVIYNLVTNAIAYTGADNKVLVRQTVIGNGVKIEVIDSGKGIEPDMIPYVWKRYYKNPYAKGHYKGVGVGLSIVKGILDSHEADYGIQSEVSKGSDFWFTLKKA